MILSSDYLGSNTNGLRDHLLIMLERILRLAKICMIKNKHLW